MQTPNKNEIDNKITCGKTIDLHRKSQLPCLITEANCCTACVLRLKFHQQKDTRRDETKSPIGKTKAKSIVYSSEHPIS